MASKTLYRKRYVPLECIPLKNDIILLEEDNLLVTSWNSLKPRNDIGSGISAYFIDKGIKISKIFTPDGHFLHWYCDMIRTTATPDSLVFEDLLIDVVIDPDGTLHILDAAEAADALRDRLITADMLCEALHSMDFLLAEIDRGHFSDYTKIIESFCS